MSRRLEPPNEDAGHGAPQWPPSGTLGPEVLEGLYEINRRYLNVLALHAPSSIREDGVVQAPALSTLEPPARATLARCPFALFNARFHDSTFWTTQLTDSAVHEPFPPFRNVHEIHPETAAFTDLALFHAWHLTRTNPLAARVVLGMSEPTLKALRRCSLSGMQRLAAEQPGLITPRWEQQSPFWRGLLHIIHTGPAERLEDMQLLAIQMIASQLVQKSPPT